MRLKSAILLSFIATSAGAFAAGAFAKDTAFLSSETAKLKIETVAEGLAHPWGLEFLPDGRMLVTERDGQLRIVAADGSLSAPISGLPALAVAGQGGLLDVMLDKDFAKNQVIYLSYAEPGADKTASTAVIRATLKDNQLSNSTVIFSQTPKVDSRHHFGGRLVQEANGNIFVTLGDRGSRRDDVQPLNTLIGKVARITPEGKAAAGNPFATTTNANPLVWSNGHRNIQGATLDGQGRLWTHEHGPQGGDEINIAKAGANYGWPLITYGEEYGGGVIGKTQQAGLEQPLHYWVPSIAPSGMTFYGGSLFKEWQQNLLVGSLKFGQLVRLVIKDDKVIHEERIRIGNRIRDVQVSSEGAVFLLTDEDNGKILKLTPLP